MNRLHKLHIATIVGVCLGVGSVSLSGPADAAATPSLATWKDTIATSRTPGAGCFTADFPSVHWRRISCTVAPLRPYVPRSGRSGRTVGNGDDYAAVTASLTATAKGSFYGISGLRNEKNDGIKNQYSLQLNTNFFSGSPACKHAQTPSSCLAWEQFVFAENGDPDPGGILFMQYWLINYNNTCPSGWISFGDDCYRNSDSAIDVPTQTILQLPYLQLSGQAVRSGIDTIILVTAKHAYSVTGNDNVVTLAKFWNASEFNVIGDGNASEATFNNGTSIGVQISLKGQTSAPTCQSNAGTTGETNNLNLGKCKVGTGGTPSIKFTQSRTVASP
jgi:hypothetical protein